MHDESKSMNSAVQERPPHLEAEKEKLTEKLCGISP